MGFCQIDGHDVYISKEKWKRAEKIVLEGHGPYSKGLYEMGRYDSISNEIMKLIEKEYLELYRKNKQQFIRDFIEFSFIDEDAQENVERILDCYIYLNEQSDVKRVGLSGKTYYLNPMASHLDNELLSYIQFDQYIQLKKKKWWDKTFNKNDYRVVSMIIDPNEIKEIKGSLEEFKIITNNNIYLFSSNVCTCYPIEFFKNQS
jgi:hypothetical protein